MEVYQMEKQRSPLFHWRSWSSVLLLCWLCILCFLFKILDHLFMLVFFLNCYQHLKSLNSACIFTFLMFYGLFHVFAYTLTIFWVKLSQGHRVVLHQTKLWITEICTPDPRVTGIFSEGNGKTSFLPSLITNFGISRSHPPTD